MKLFHNANQALAYLVECEIATLQMIRERSRSSKSDLRRQESIVQSGLQNCKLFVSPEDARRATANRVEEFLLGKRNDLGERVNPST